MEATADTAARLRILAHRAPDPTPEEEPVPEPRPVPEEDPVPDHNPERRCSLRTGTRMTLI